MREHKRKLRTDKTVRDAAKLLPEGMRKLFVRAFEVTRCYDCYNGDPEAYMAVITQELLARQKKVLEVSSDIRTVKSIIAKYSLT